MTPGLLRHPAAIPYAGIILQRRRAVILATIHPYTDSSLVENLGESPEQFGYVNYPPYSGTYLRDFLAHLRDGFGGDVASAVQSLGEPGLYALSAALALGLHEDQFEAGDNLRDALVAELRSRNCKGMGTQPRGSVRRGRLVQIAATCTTLAVAGASALQRHNLAGDCPFCRAPDFRVFLPPVSWRCFACGRQGGLLEFAESLLHTDAGYRPDSTHSRYSAASMVAGASGATATTSLSSDDVRTGTDPT